MFSTTKNGFAPALLVFTMMFACKEKQPAAPKIRDITVQPKFAQENPGSINMDKSPMDIIYYPVDYPVLKMSGKINTPPIARILYSRPTKDGRIIFGNVVKYGAYWRLGANESTEIEFFTDVNILGRKVNKGRYIIYCIPYEKRWVIKLNDDLFTWGLKVHSTKDLYSFDIPVYKNDKLFDVFTMAFYRAGRGVQLMIAWDDIVAYLPIKL